MLNCKVWLAVACFMVAMMLGCSGVIMNAQYSSLLDETAAWSANMAARDTAGSLTPEQKSEALQGNAALWERFRDARDGRSPD